MTTTSQWKIQISYQNYANSICMLSGEPLSFFCLRVALAELPGRSNERHCGIGVTVLATDQRQVLTLDYSTRVQEKLEINTITVRKTRKPHIDGSMIQRFCFSAVCSTCFTVTWTWRERTFIAVSSEHKKLNSYLLVQQMLIEKYHDHQQSHTTTPKKEKLFKNGNGANLFCLVNL